MQASRLGLTPYLLAWQAEKLETHSIVHAFSRIEQLEHILDEKVLTYLLSCGGLMRH